jgi:hypothetical protein
MKSKATLVSAHDLGGANQILYATRNKRSHYYALTGPAIKVAQTLNLPNILNLDSINLSDYDNLLVASNLRHEYSDSLMVEALSNHKIKVTGYLDHWVNFDSRWTIAPHKVIVSDLRAYLAALPYFGAKVRLHPNYYLANLLQNQKTNVLQHKVFTNQSVLVILQPIGERYLHKKTLDLCLCEEMTRFLQRNHFDRLFFRNHVDTSAERCCEYMATQFPNITFEVSHWSSSLEQDLIRAEAVIGIDSYALYVAQKLGKKVFTVGGRRSKFSPKYTRL